MESAQAEINVHPKCIPFGHKYPQDSKKEWGRKKTEDAIKESCVRVALMQQKFAHMHTPNWRGPTELA